jgi:hypothetical protein
MKRKKTGETHSLYIRNDLWKHVEALTELSDMNPSDIVNMVLEEAHLEELIKQKQDGGKN